MVGFAHHPQPAQQLRTMADPTNPLALIARCHGSQIIGELTEGKIAGDATMTTATDGIWRVTITIEPCRHYAPGAAPLPRSRVEGPGSASDPIAHLRTTHARCVAVLTDDFQQAREIARRIGLSPRSSHVRQALADLVRFHLAQHVDGKGYAKARRG